MFRYAAAISMSEQFKHRYFLSNLGSLKYFKLTKKDYLVNFFKLNYVVWIFLKLFGASKIDVTNGWNYADYMEQFKRLNGNYLVRGCLGHPSFFFMDYENISKYFQVKIKYQQRYNILYREFQKYSKLVVIHVRKGDYETFKVEGLGNSDMTLPLNYYKKIINNYNQNEVKLIFLSDNIAQVKKDFNYLQNAYFSTENEITDLQFLMYADVCILSCSTFSWWGAALNSKANKLVYVPKYFLGFKVGKEYPEGIIPEQWIKVDVFDDNISYVSMK